MIQFLTQNAPYVVLVTVLIIWLGIAAYLWRIDSKLRNLEKNR